MSLRIKALFIAFQVSALMWGTMIYIGHAIYTAEPRNLDLISTASTD